MRSYSKIMQQHTPNMQIVRRGKRAVRRVLVINKITVDIVLDNETRRVKPRVHEWSEWKIKMTMSHGHTNNRRSDFP